MIYNFRIDRENRDFLKQELINKNIIYQGWGNFSISEDNFIKNTQNFYSLRTTRIPSNLIKMRNFHDGDILLIPHFPKDGCGTFLIVNGEYPANYKWKLGNKHHLNHGIKVKEIHGLNGNISMYHHLLVGWYGKLSGLRLPILPIETVAETIEKLISELRNYPETVFTKSTIDDYLTAQTKTLLINLREQLMVLNPSNGSLSFEKVCEDLISQYGYKLIQRNAYDKQGGDADLIFEKKNETASPFEIGESYLFVQVKKHRGETDDKAVNQLIQIMDSKKEYTPSYGCVISLSDNFSENAMSKAEDAGIKLINGIEFCKLLSNNALFKMSD
ncbi:restriction endonuclease [Priestia aryabhattai]